MATPDVRVKLTAEGVSEVVAAFRKIEKESQQAAQKSARSFRGLSTAIGEVKALLPAIGVAVAVASLGRLAKAGLDLADSMGKTAQKTGAAVESLSVLAFAATTADVEFSQLSKGLVFLSRNLKALGDGADKQEETFAALGLTVKDFAGKDTAASFVVIADKLAKVRDSSLKTALAMDIFGKSGAELIPLLNDVGREGFDKLREKAEQLGLIIDEETAAAAQAANDNFTTIGNQAKGLAVQFASGFAPVVAGAMQRFTDDTKGKGAGAMREFGQTVGRVLVTVINTFRLFGNVVSGIIVGIGNQLFGVAGLFKAAFSGDLTEALRIWKRMGEDGRRDFAAFKSQFKTDLDRLVTDALREPEKFELKPTLDTGALEEVESRLERSARERAEKEAQREADRLRREAEAREREEDRLAEQRAQLETRLLELQGRTREAKLAALEEELRKTDELLQKQKVGDMERLAILAQLRTLASSRINFEELQSEAGRVFDAVARDRQRIENEVALGIKTQAEGQAELAELEKSRLDNLNQIVAATLAAAEATKDPEAIAAAQQLALETQNLQVEVRKTADSWTSVKEAGKSAAESGIINALTSIGQSAESASDQVRSFFRGIAQAIQQALAQIIAAQAIKAFFGGFGFADGGVVRAASGGMIRGPGTGTSDSIPALLSDGEHVNTARATSSTIPALELLEWVNNRVGRLRTPAPRFAGGGLAEANVRQATTAEGGGVTRVVNVFDPDLLVEAMMSSAGERVVLNHVRRNKRGLSRDLRG